MSTPRFDAFILFILQWETEFLLGHDGDYNFVRTEHDPDDPGGTTKFGIDQRSHPSVNIGSLTLQEAKDIYFGEWALQNIETFQPNLGEVYFNASVNAGKGRADKLLALANGSAKAFILAQRDFYRGLANAHPVMRKYLKGWINRLNALWDFLKLGSLAS